MALPEGGATVGDHSSKAAVTNRPLAANPGPLGSGILAAVCLAAPARAGPLFGIAPGGACRAACVTTRAVGSYPTVSP